MDACHLNRAAHAMTMVRTAERAVMTAGPIWRQLAAFSLPLLAGSLVQQLYSTVDLMFVGQTLGTEAAAAIGSSSLVVTCLVGFFTGLRVGVAVTAARAVGNGDHQQLRQVVRAAAGLSLGVLLLFLAAGGHLAGDAYAF